ncbi:ammonia-dependent NAD(+) synthetase [Pseudactinotalea sp. HY158]|uniref:ammonia-dependent NAD(+) synthetase n=1 Tax=Pseudactinotalea sp. HY158 TaxID=2654547 RepID=UPI00129C599A|nr:ammonia-dependent NAD(+) synthetase [Pseudactinotalea sp. HY158]QGH69403.1 ammonia-dependent NAD(+) synthetase [Pseudactinotalea sp. HY158]
MHRLQELIIATVGARPRIDPPAELRRRIDFLRDYLARTGLGGFVLGISGGQDSTLAGRLAQRAVTELRADGARVVFVAVRLPYRVQFDEDDAQKALDFIQPDEVITLDVGGATDALVAQGSAAGAAWGDVTRGNVKARLRMTAQYAIAGERSLAVLGTDHAAEAVTGFYTKFGDGAADLTPLAGLTKRQGRALLVAAGSPAALYEKVPTADLLDQDPGQSDEASLGLTYDQIDDYLEGKTIEERAAADLEAKFWASRHKRRQPIGPDDTWWREA